MPTCPPPRTSPRRLVNPVLGLSAHVVTTAADSGGALLAAETEVQPGGNGGPIHQHRRQEERFLLHEGTLRYRVGRRRGVLRAGETLVVPPGTAHAFRNDGAHVARMRAEFRPALRLEEFFYPPFPPVPVVRALAAPLGWVAARRGI